MENTLPAILGRIISDEPVSLCGIIHHTEGVDRIPASIELSGLEVTLVDTMSRETILREYLNSVREQYDVVLLDCCPSLGMMTINTLAVADEVLISMQTYYLSKALCGIALVYATASKNSEYSSESICYSVIRN